MFEKWGLFIDEGRGLISAGHSPSAGGDSPNVEGLTCPIVHWFKVPGTSLMICFGVLGSTVVLVFRTRDQIFVRSKTVYVFGNWFSSS
jgi:hypothetical protein